MAAASESSSIDTRMSGSRVMNPLVKIISDEKNRDLRFSLNNTNVSFANAIRRTILSDIPTPVFRTTPYDKSLCTIHKNTSRLTNEILKQRISCIPIHIADGEFDLSSLLVELNVTNDTDAPIYVTTKDFKIKDTTSGKYLPQRILEKVFPANDITKDNILIARLRPKITTSIPGEEISLESKIVRSTASEDSCFNVTSTCSYAFTQDKIKQKEVWRAKAKELKKEGLTEEEVEFEEKNWYLNDAKRIYVDNSFEFVIQSIGVYSNTELVKKACAILVDKCNIQLDQIAMQKIPIIESQTTMQHSFDITLENEDYTLGKCIEYIIHSAFYRDAKVLSFVGFSKSHPYDKDSLIRIAFNEARGKADVLSILSNAVNQVKDYFTKVGNAIA